MKFFGPRNHHFGRFLGPEIVSEWRYLGQKCMQSHNDNFCGPRNCQDDSKDIPGTETFYVRWFLAPQICQIWRSLGPKNFLLTLQDWWPKKLSFWDDFWPQKSSKNDRENLYGWVLCNLFHWSLVIDKMLTCVLTISLVIVSGHKLEVSWFILRKIYCQSCHLGVVVN